MPVLISLQQIRDKSPCQEEWAQVLKSRGGQSADMQEMFPLADIIGSNRLSHAVWALRCLDSPLIAQKFALGCAGMVRHLMKDKRSPDCLDVVARYLRGEASHEEMLVAGRNASATAAYATAAARKEITAKLVELLRELLA